MFLTVLAAAASCGGSGPSAGDETGPCYPNGTCNSGLICLSDVCVRPNSPDAAPGQDADPDPADSGTIDATSFDAAPPDATPLLDECSMNTDDCIVLALCVDRTNGFSCVGDAPQLCLDGSTVHGRSEPMDALAAAPEVTIELWYRSRTATAERQLFLFHGNTLAEARGVGLSIVDASAQGFTFLNGRVLHLAVDARANGGNLNARGFDLDAAIPAFDETEWHHYAIVLDGTTQRAFVDGTELTATQQRDGAEDTGFADAFGAAFPSGDDIALDVGWFPRDGTRLAHGLLDDLRVSTTARYTGAFTPTHPLTGDANTLAVYSMDAGTGAISADSSGNGLDIAWTGSPWDCERYSLQFDGIDDGVASATPLTHGLSSEITIEYWLRTDQAGVWMKLLNIHNDDDRDVDMEIRADNRVYCTLFDQTGQNHGATSASTLAPGSWYHIACTYDGANQRTFINGVLEAQSNWTGQVQLADTVTISGFESRFVAATIDEFRLSTTARYSANFTPPTHFASDSDTTVLWWFDEGIGAMSQDWSGNGHHAVLGTGPNVTGLPAWITDNH